MSWIRAKAAKIRLTCKAGVRSKSHLELRATGGPVSPHPLELSQGLMEITHKIAEDRSNQSEQNAECGGSCAVGGRMPNQPIAKKADNGIGWVRSVEEQNLQEPQACAHVSHRVGSDCPSFSQFPGGLFQGFRDSEGFRDLRCIQIPLFVRDLALTLRSGVL